MADRFPRIPLALHAGYFLRLMRFGRCILDQKRLSSAILFRPLIYKLSLIS